MRGKKTESAERKTASRAPARKAAAKPKAKRSASAGRKTAARRKVAAKPGGARRGSIRRTAASRTRPAAEAYGSGTPASSARPEVTRVIEEARVLAERPYEKTTLPADGELPGGYGKDRIVAMVRDPYWVHAYWELTRETVSRGLRSLGKEAMGARRILRVYSGETKTARPANFLFDVALTPDARNWYINVGGPGRTYRVEIGLLTRTGKYVCLASSNSVSMPPDRMSDVLDEEWANVSPEYYAEMYALSGGLAASRAPLSSPGLAERLARRLEERLASPVFSPGVSAGVGVREMEAPFWLRLDADLIVYGATVPGSHLTVEGGSSSLREDGTFSFRCHLPDGSKDIKVTSRSKDGTKQERIRLTVTRATGK